MIRRLLFLAVFLIGQSAIAAETEFYFYINGDNDLVGVDANGKQTHQAEKVFQKLTQIALQAGDQAAFHIYYDPNGAVPGVVSPESRIVRIAHREMQEELRWLETNSGDPKWLELLLSRSYLSGEALRTLVLWGHGDGWKDMRSYDFSESEKSFSYREFSKVLSTNPVDLLVFDACKMAYLEVLSSFKKGTRAIVASQFELSGEGIEYANLVSHLSALKDVPRDQVLPGLYHRLHRDTLSTQKESGILAPLVYFKSEAIAGVISALKDALDAFLSRLDAVTDASLRARLYNRVIESSRPRNDRVMRGDPGAVDIRAFQYRLKMMAEVDRPGLVEKFEEMSLEKFGSLQFYLPSQLGEKASPAVVPYLGIDWGAVLPNWEIVKKWSR